MGRSFDLSLLHKQGFLRSSSLNVSNKTDGDQTNISNIDMINHSFRLPLFHPACSTEREAGLFCEDIPKPRAAQPGFGRFGKDKRLNEEPFDSDETV